MIALVLIICLLLLAALFVALRYEGHAKRDSRHGELQEPLISGIWRGITEDLRRVVGKFTRA